MHHSPTHWVLIDATVTHLLLHSMCSCGHEDCAWTVTADARRATNSITGDFQERD